MASLRPPTQHAPAMSPDEAIAWLREVDGELYRTPPGRRGREAWVAVVRTPRVGDQRGRMIVALGETLQDAASAAARRWRALWRPVETLH